MLKIIERRHSISRILNYIKKPEDMHTIISCENKLMCMFTSKLLFLFAFLNAILRYHILEASLSRALTESAIYILLGIGFELVLRVKMKLTLMIQMVAGLYVISNLIVLITYYESMGAMIWFIMTISMFVTMFQVNNTALVVFGTLISTTGILIYIVVMGNDISIDKNQYGIYLVLFLLLFLLAIFLHRYHEKRYTSMFLQFQSAREEKKRIKSLYKKVAANEEELYQKNETLIEYNNRIKISEKKFYHMAYHDGLTELPNRKMVEKKLLTMIDRAEKNNEMIYVVYIDIDSFKSINDTMGHEAGDIFIRTVASRVQDFLKKEDIIGRLGGDEFTILISSESDSERIMDYLEEIKDKFEEPVTIYGVQVGATASLGVAQYPKDGKDFNTLFRNADSAMYRSKEQGKNSIQYYDFSILKERQKK